MGEIGSSEGCDGDEDTELDWRSVFDDDEVIDEFILDAKCCKKMNDTIEEDTSTNTDLKAANR